MPIPKKWSKMNRAKITQSVPTKGGIYELTSFGEERPLYIGSSGDLQRRLLEHLEERRPNRFRVETSSLFQSPTSLEKKAFEQYEGKYGDIPPWNTQDPRSGWF